MLFLRANTKVIGQADVIIFNPPYVVTSAQEFADAQKTKSIEASWAGGEDGIQMLEGCLPQIIGALSSKGVFYLLLIEENLSIIHLLESKYHLFWSVVIKRQVRGEN